MTLCLVLISGLQPSQGVHSGTGSTASYCERYLACGVGLQRPYCGHAHQSGGEDEDQVLPVLARL